MIPYFLLIFIPVPFLWIEIKKRRNRNNQLETYLAIGSVERNMLLPVFFLLLFILLALRGESVGSDTQNYHRNFLIYGNQSVVSILREWREPLFKLLGHYVYRLTGSYQVFLTLTAALQIIPIANVYLQDRRYSYLKMILFVNMVTFVMLFSGIRQAISISLGLTAFACIQEKHTGKFLLCALTASLFHTSGVIVFLLYPICRMRLHRKQFIWMIIITTIIFVQNRPIFSFLMNIYLWFSPREYEVISNTGAFMSLILFALFTIFAFFITDDTQIDDEICALRNILVVTVILQCFAPLHTLAMRINYYFIIFIPLALGKCLTCQNKKYAYIAQLGTIILCIYFTYEFCSSIYTGYVTGISDLNTVPYVPFWNS